MTPSRHDKVALVFAEDGEYYHPVSNLMHFFLTTNQLYNCEAKPLFEIKQC